MQKHLFAIKVNMHLSVMHTIKYNKNVMAFRNCWNIIGCTWISNSAHQVLPESQYNKIPPPNMPPNNQINSQRQVEFCQGHEGFLCHTGRKNVFQLFFGNSLIHPFPIPTAEIGPISLCKLTNRSTNFYNFLLSPQSTHLSHSIAFIE